MYMHKKRDIPSINNPISTPFNTGNSTGMPSQTYESFPQ